MQPIALTLTRRSHGVHATAIQHVLHPRGTAHVTSPMLSLACTPARCIDPHCSIAHLQVSVRTWAVLHHRLRLAEKLPQEAATALLLRGLMELCIYGAAPTPRGRGVVGGSEQQDGEHLPVPWSCTDTALLQVRARIKSSMG